MQSNPVRSYFDSVACEYGKGRTHVAQEYPLVRVRSEWAARFFLENIRSPGAQVLDLGCGPADLVERLGEDGFRVHGLDLSPGMVQEAKRRLAAKDLGPDRAEVEVGDIAHWHPRVILNRVIFKVLGPLQMTRNFAVLARKTSG